MSYEPLLNHVVPYLLVVFRLSGVFLLGPYFSGFAVPARVKLMILLMVGGATYPIVPPGFAANVSPDLATLLPLIVGEMLIGLVIGFIASLPLMCLETAGVLIGQQIGFGLARVYNPEADFEADLLGQMLFYLGSGIFLAIGGLESLFLAVVRTFEHVPAGGISMKAVPLDLILGTLTAGFELAVRVSAPVVGIIFMLVILLGAVGKTIPQINVMSVGFTVKIFAGLSMLAAAIYTVDAIAGDEVSRVMQSVLRFAEQLRPSAS